MTVPVTVARTPDGATDERHEGLPDGYVVGPASQRRRDRHDARQMLWRESHLKRVQLCGRHATSEAGVQLRVVTGPDGKRTAGIGGVQSCGSVWACPVCSATILARRQQEVFTALQRWHSRGHRVVAATFTMRHRRHHRLEDLWDALADAWDAVRSGRQWRTDQLHYGAAVSRRIKTGKRAGQLVEEHRIWNIRAVEITHGDNGWHVHVHALLFVRDGLGDSDVQLLLDSMFGRWKRALRTAKLPLPTRKHGVEGHLLRGDELAATWADYLTKASYAGSAELTRFDHKEARGGNRTPFRVLADLKAHGDAADLSIWHEYERVSQGRKQLTWAPGLREWLGMVKEQSDEEIVAEDLGGRVLRSFHDYEGRRLWRHLTATGQVAIMCEAAECSDEAAHRWLTAAEARARAAWAAAAQVPRPVRPRE